MILSEIGEESDFTHRSIACVALRSVEMTVFLPLCAMASRSYFFAKAANSIVCLSIADVHVWRRSYRTCCMNATGMAVY